MEYSFVWSRWSCVGLTFFVWCFLSTESSLSTAFSLQAKRCGCDFRQKQNLGGRSTKAERKNMCSTPCDSPPPPDRLCMCNVPPASHKCYSPTHWHHFHTRYHKIILSLCWCKILEDCKSTQMAPRELSQVECFCIFICCYIHKSVVYLYK